MRLLLTRYGDMNHHFLLGYAFLSSRMEPLEVEVNFVNLNFFRGFSVIDQNEAAKTPK